MTEQDDIAKVKAAIDEAYRSRKRDRGRSRNASIMTDERKREARKWFESEEEREAWFEKQERAKEKAERERPCPLCGEPINSYTRVRHLQECPNR